MSTHTDSIISLGTTTVSCETLDNAGNSTSTTFTVTVEDTQSPEFDYAFWFKHTR